MRKFEVSNDELAEKEIPEALKRECNRRFLFDRWDRTERVGFWRAFMAMGALPSEAETHQHLAALMKDRSYTAFDLMTRWLCSEAYVKGATYFYKKANILTYNCRSRTWSRPHRIAHVDG